MERAHQGLQKIQKIYSKIYEIISGNSSNEPPLQFFIQKSERCRSPILFPRPAVKRNLYYHGLACSNLFAYSRELEKRMFPIF